MCADRRMNEQVTIATETGALCYAPLRRGGCVGRLMAVRWELGEPPGSVRGCLLSSICNSNQVNCTQMHVARIAVLDRATI